MNQGITVNFILSPENNKWQLIGGDGKPIDVANDFLRSLDIRGLSQFTIRAYGYDLVTLYRWLAGTGKAIEELQQKDLLEFIEEQRKASIHPRSINRRLSTARVFYRFCTDEEMPYGKGLTLSPTHYKRAGHDHNLGIYRVRRKPHRALQVQTPKTLIDPLTKEQVLIFLRSLRRYRDIAIVYLMLLCGLRVGEVLGLKMGDITFEGRTVRVYGKGKKQRIVPLPEILITTIEDYLRFERPNRVGDDHLFVVMQGKKRGLPMTYQGLRSIFRRRRQNTQIRNANPHSWRHTCGADLARNGVGIVTIQNILGHADIQTTAQYINLSMADIAREYQKASTTIIERYKAGDN